MPVRARTSEFSKWIYAHRTRAGLTQDKAAEIAGISRATWTRYEMEDDHKKDRETVIRIAKALDADIAETLKLAGFEAESIWPADKRELLYYYDGLPPICKRDMVSLAKTLYENHVELGKRAARIAAAAGRSQSTDAKDISSHGDPPAEIVFWHLPADWQNDPQWKDFFARVGRPMNPDQVQGLLGRKKGA
jgi:transcriptional regulator with XRE-family HTH domain